MNIGDIEAFVAVAETGSVNRAAIRLNITQPAATRRIQNFEDAMGAGSLLNRSVKPAVLTSLGQHVLEKSRRVLAALAELEACAQKETNPSGDLKLGVAHGLGEMVLTSPLDTLRRAFPRIKLQVSSNWSKNLIEEVRSGQIDCAVGLLTEEHTVPAGLVRLSLGAEEVVVVGPSRLEAGRGGKPWRLRDLADKGWFLNPRGCGCRAALVRNLEQMQLPVNIAAEVFGEDLQLSLLTHSGGLSLVPRRQFEQSPHRGDLTILEVSDFVLPATVALVRNASPGRFEVAMDLLVDGLKSKLKADL
ncbi:MAG: LysR family transcriptional regulator [Pseudomonadota bacterium]